MKKGFTLIELLIVIAIVAVFVMIGVPMFDKYTVKNDVVTKASEVMLLLETAQILSNNAEQGDQAFFVRHNGNMIKVKKSTGNAGCVVSSPITWSNLETVEGANIQGYTFSSFKDEAWICFAVDGKSVYFDGENEDQFPEKIEVSSGSYDSYNIGLPPKISIRAVGGNQTNNKYLFSLE